MNGSQSVALIDLHTDSIDDMKSQRDNAVGSSRLGWMVKRKRRKATTTI